MTEAQLPHTLGHTPSGKNMTWNCLLQWRWFLTHNFYKPKLTFEEHFHFWGDAVLHHTCSICHARCWNIEQNMKINSMSAHIRIHQPMWAHQEVPLPEILNHKTDCDSTATTKQHNKSGHFQILLCLQHEQVTETGMCPLLFAGWIGKPWD